MSPKKKDLGVNEIFLFPKMKELLMEFWLLYSLKKEVYFYFYFL